MNDLVAAGRAAREVMSMAYTAFRYSEEGRGEEPSEDEVYESVAQAVLEVLGIEIDGWEWRVSFQDKWGQQFSYRPTKGQAQDVARETGGTVQRRRKVSVKWEDLSA